MLRLFLNTSIENKWNHIEDLDGFFSRVSEGVNNFILIYINYLQHTIDIQVSSRPWLHYHYPY